MTQSMDMPEGEFEAISLFTGEGVGGREWVSRVQPRLRFRDTFYRSGVSSREWFVDGDTVSSREEADRRLAVPPRLDVDEASVLAAVGRDWTPAEHLLRMLHPESRVTPAQERLDLALDALNVKGMIERGHRGVRLHRPWKKPPDPELQRRNDPADPIYFYRGPADIGADERIRELAPPLDLKLRLVPVLTWPHHRVPSHIPTFPGKIDIGAIDDEHVLAQITLAQRQGSKNLSTPKALDGCCILVEDGGAERVLFEPKQRIGLGDIASWEAAAAGMPLLAHQMQDARTGWMKLDIGDWLAVLPQGDRVYLGTSREFDGLPLGPLRGWPIWNIAAESLAAAVAEAYTVIDRLAALLDLGLGYDLSDEERPAIIARMIRPREPPQPEVGPVEPAHRKATDHADTCEGHGRG